MLEGLAEHPSSRVVVDLKIPTFELKRHFGYGADLQMLSVYAPNGQRELVITARTNGRRQKRVGSLCFTAGEEGT